MELEIQNRYLSSRSEDFLELNSLILRNNYDGDDAIIIALFMGSQGPFSYTAEGIQPN